MNEKLNEMLKENEIILKDNLFLGGEEPSFEDAIFFKILIEKKYKLSQKEYPSIWAWYSIMILFDDEVIKEWLRHPHKKIKKEKGKKKEGREKIICDEPDDYDINIDYKEKIEEQRNKHKEEISIVFLEIKPEGDIDLNFLADKIMKEIKREGMKWIEKYEIKEIGFNIKKLIMGMKVKLNTSVQDIIDQLETWEECIQSVDFALFIQY